MKKPPLDRRALGRALTQIANADMRELAQRPQREALATARRIGITGAPGAGKSTLLGHLALERIQGGRIGVLAVDPSSPRSGGAILGDRVRMDELEGSSELFIRSLGSRRTSDGLADNLSEMLDAMDAFGFDEVLLETVGVGQTEYAARVQVDTLVLVLLPESGDTVQAMKAGIMEMADIFVINKSDLSGAQRMATDIRRIAALSEHAEGAWIPPVLLTSATRPDSIRELSEAIDRHQGWLNTCSRQQLLREQRARYRLRRLIEARIADAIGRQDADFLKLPLEQQVNHIARLVGQTARSLNGAAMTGQACHAEQQ
ncbi:methylmalonyl Co-A mutase-associated GTPase MeaB [Cupriavidus sp. AcVe19-6a]|uniref:methylmalonyl Co-A mutase-associated GTPase MeaB n=1 Tax=Cupriavidus sp. AcVe19-6a TaxID=2821358 RepID=UPI001AE59A70|nr:methylmalonyl Co-A mutase-associated GTPase MeaB [Cupriavidus sp. AcVe19-6a]MBP0639606.1 methylmalonyl Co-A mutase-associated GTPase MeaB [Cupriavidus sp. AcVe19-6a]